MVSIFNDGEHPILINNIFGIDASKLEETMLFNNESIESVNTLTVIPYPFFPYTTFH